MANVTKVEDLAYLGRRVQQYEIRDGGSDSPRWVYTYYVDDADPRNGGYPAGSATKRRIRGNALRGTFKELEPRTAITANEFERARVQ